MPGQLSFPTLAGPLLIVGPTGSGRRHRARLLLQAQASEFVPPQSTLAFVEVVSSGYLVPDIEMLHRKQQRELLSFLKSHSHPVVCTARPEIDNAHRRKSFSHSLYKRLGANRIDMLPLADRPAEISEIAPRLLDSLAKGRLGRRLKLSKDSLELLARYSWPGNVGELKDVLWRVILTTGCANARQLIPVSEIYSQLPQSSHRVPDKELCFDDLIATEIDSFLAKLEGYNIDELHGHFMTRVEKILLTRVLEHTGGNQLKTAEMLGLSRNTLRRKLEDYGVRAKLLSKGRRRSSGRISNSE